MNGAGIMLIRSLFRLFPLLVIVIFVIQGCGDRSTVGNSATLHIAMGGQTQTLSSHDGAGAATLSPLVDKVIIRILSDSERVLAEGKLVPNGTPLALPVPAGVPLSVEGTAYAGDDILYTGSVDVAPLRSGRTVVLDLTLSPYGTLTTRVVTQTYQIDLSEQDQAGNQGSGVTIFSEDNRWVAFHSRATNLSPDDTNEHLDVFIKNLVTGGVTNVHTASDGVTLGNGELTFADITANARTVVFASEASNLVPGDNNGVGDVFVKNVDDNVITRISLTVSGQELAEFSAFPTISDDGKFVSFYTNSSVTEDGNTGVFLLERTGENVFEKRHVGDGWRPRLSGDGNWLIYRGVDTDALWLYDIVYDIRTRIIDYAATEASHRINQDGNYIVFDTTTNFDPRDTDGAYDIYLYNRDNRTLKLLSTDRDGQPLSGADSGAVFPSISNDGRYVTFNFGDLIYVKDAVKGEIAPLEQPGKQAFISPNGHLIAYNAEDNHLYVTPNPLFVQTPPAGDPIEPEEHPVPGSDPVYRINVNKTGTGAELGHVSSNDAAIDCGADCSETYSAAVTLSLSATASEGARFTGWSGSCSTSENPLTLAVDGIKNCTANFELVGSHSITVVVDGDGQGTVSGDGHFTDCNTDCSASFTSATTVTLSASAGANSHFTGWSGACTGTDPVIAVAVNGNQTCYATFLANDFEFKLTMAGDLQNDKITAYNANTESILFSCEHIEGTPPKLCVERIPRDIDVFLSVTFGGNNNSVSWSNCPDKQPSSCTIVMDGNKEVSATFGAGSFPLTITPNANGTITDDGQQINCGGDCEGSYVNMTDVILTATPSSGYRIGYWGGACSGSGNTAQVTMNAAKTCSVTFVQRFTLTIETIGNGSVGSSPGNINCPGTCNSTFDTGQSVTLTATPGTDSTFNGWGKNCAGTSNPLQITMSGAKTCSASFVVKSYTLTVTTAGQGTVVINPDNINCGTGCTPNFNHGSALTLVPTPAAGYVFSNWSGDCDANGNVTMTSAKSCTANFRQNVFTLTVTSSGQGSVTINPGNISCGTGCTRNFNAGQTLTLTPSPAADYVFTNWSGDCDANGNVTMTSAKTCTANFALDPLIANLNFTDTNLQNCVRNYAASKNPAWTRVSEFVDLSCQGFVSGTADTRIANLAGVEKLTALAQLALATHRFSDLTPVAKSQVSSLVLINTANVLDFSSLASSKSLNVLVVSAQKQLSDLASFSKLTSLKQLWIDQSSISDITPLGTLTGLTHLYLSKNRVSTGISVLGAYTKPTSIYFEDEPVLPCNDIMALDKLKDASDGGFLGIVRWNTCTLPTTSVTSTLTINQTFTADLDLGSNQPVSDIWFEAATATARYITARSTAKLLETGTAAIGFGACYTNYVSGKLTATRIPISDPTAAGKYFCAITNENRISEFRITQALNAPGATVGTLVISVTTWTITP